MDSLTAHIEIPPAQAGSGSFAIILKIENKTGQSLQILNPDMGKPMEKMGWPYSQETYQIAMLMSFHYLTSAVKDASGQDVPQQAIATWSTPVIMPKVQLAPGSSLALTIPLSDFYSLKSQQSYRVSVSYGDKDLKVTADAPFQFP